MQREIPGSTAFPKTVKPWRRAPRFEIGNRPDSFLMSRTSKQWITVPLRRTFINSLPLLQKTPQSSAMVATNRAKPEHGSWSFVARARCLTAISLPNGE